MTEFARLLRDAAGQPPRPLPMAAIYHRAARRSLRRRVGFGLAVLAALAGLGGPAGVSVLTTGDRPAHVDAVRIEDRREPTPSTRPVERRPSHETTATSAVSVSSDSASAVPDVGAPSSVSLTTTTTTASSTDGGSAQYTGSRTGAARASSCWVDNVDSGNRTVRAGDSVRCRFTAAVSGGWNVHQERGSTSPLESEIVTAVVHVTRNGVTTTYRTREVKTANGSRTEGCADDVIQPGDLVEVVLSESEDDTPLDVSPDEGVAVGAGEGWGCTAPGQPDWATGESSNPSE